ncbi:MAG: AI-2E family transporter [Phocaeicola plebeius]|nr:AI-2E family transporter [Phocaeicola plebeius]
MMMKETYWKYSLCILILGLGYLLFCQAQPYMNGILGAFTLYVLLRKPCRWLQRKINPTAAVWLITLGVTLFMIVPLTGFAWALISQLSGIHLDAEAVIRPAGKVIDFIEEKTGFDLLSEQSMTFVVTQVSTIGQKVMSGVSDLFINLFVAIMVLFFMLFGGRNMEQYIHTLLPFKEKYKMEVLEEVDRIVRSNAIGIPLLAIIQGIISLGGYWLCSAPNPILTAMLTGFASIIPLVGTTIVWIPVVGYLMVIGDWVNAFILLAYGSIVIAQCDNLIRLLLQKRMADIHPLVTIFGVVAGLPIFGFMGLVFGPLLVSLFLLFLDMYRKEYLLPGEGAIPPADGQG